MPAFNETYFEPDYLDLFWQFLTERMRIYWRRQAGSPPPWTNDPIMRNEFITNVYRELDPGTQHIMINVLQTEERVEDKLLNIMVYRLLGSRIETQVALGFLKQDDPGLVAHIETVLRGIKDAGTAPFGDAYRTAAYVEMGTKDKITNVARLCGVLAEQIPAVWAELQNSISPENAFQVLNNIKGFGEFLAYQIMVDFLYPAPFEPILPYDQETWAMAGPGARRGIWQLLKPGMKPSSLLEVMRWLRDNQHAEFERLGLEFPFLEDGARDGNPPIPISLCNIQASLCEYFKYTRIWTGQLTYARKYNYNERLVNRFDELPVTPPPEPGRVQGVGNVMVGAPGPDVSGSGKHHGLGGAAVAGGVLLDLPGGQHGEGPLPAPQGPANDPSEMVDVEVDVLATPSAGLDNDKVRRQVGDELENLPTDKVNAGLQTQRRRGGDAQVPEDVLAVPGYGSGSGQGEVEPYDNDVLVALRITSNRRVKHVSIDFD